MPPESNEFTKLETPLVRDWLRRTPEGRKLVSEEVGRALEHKGVDVLVVMHPDGYAEVYSWRFVRVHFANMPRRTSELNAEKAFEERLPLRIRDLYWPNAMHDLPGKVASMHVADGRFETTDHLTSRLRVDELMEDVATVLTMRTELLSSFRETAELLNEI